MSYNYNNYCHHHEGDTVGVSVTTEWSHWLTLVLSPPPDVPQRCLGQQTHAELLTSRDMIDDIIPGKISDCLIFNVSQ